MNKRILKWLLISAVIAGAAAYLFFDSGKKDGRTLADVSSKPVDVELAPGFRVTAPENALDKDREFTLKPVSEKEAQQMREAVAEISGESVFLTFELSAGLKTDEYLPGLFTCEIDLEQLGIPPAVYPYLRVWKKKGDEYLCFDSQIKDGKLIFQSDQNKWFALSTVLSALKKFALTVPTKAAVAKLLGAGLGLGYLVETGWKAYTTSTLYDYFIFRKEDTVVYPVDDEYGNFDVYFSYKQTENADKFPEFKENYEKMLERLARHVEQADITYTQLHPDKSGMLSTHFWTSWSGSDAEKELAYKDLTRAEILAKMLEKDDEFQEWKKKSPIPTSVLDLVENLKKANRFLTDHEGFKPQTYRIPVYLVDSEHANGSATYYRTLTKLPYMVVNFSYMSGGPGVGNYTFYKEDMLLSVNHELYHHREKTHYWPCMMDFRTEETLAAYNEKAAHAYFTRQGDITLPWARLSSGASDRSSYEMYGGDFNVNVSPIPTIAPGAEGGYVYADLMDYLQKKHFGEDNFLTGNWLLFKYSYLSSHSTNYKAWFKIKDDEVFANDVRGFCKEQLKTIYAREASSEAKKEMPANACEDISLNWSFPVMPIDTRKGELMMRTIRFTKQDGFENTPFNLFVVRGKDCQEKDFTFYASPDEFKETILEGDYFPLQSASNVFAYFKVPEESSKKAFTLVAFFAPDQPMIHGVKKDKISFTLPDAPTDLLRSKYVTGAVITYKDKNGYVQTKDVAPRYFGKKVGWKISGCGALGNEFTLSVHWYYKPDTDTVYESPESELAKWGVKDKPKQEEYEGPAPTANYWKQTASRVLKQNSAKDESFLQTEETEPDYRSLEDIQVEQESRSCEFTGLAAFEEKGEDGKKHYVKTPFLEGAVTFTEPPKAWRPGTQYRLQWDIEENPYLLRVKEPFVFEAIGASSAQGVCRKTHAEKQNTGHSSTGKVDWMRSCWATFEAWSPEEGEPHFFTLSQTFTIQERPGSDRKTSVTLEYDYQWVGEAEPEKPISESVGHWQLKEALVSEEKLTDTNEDGTKATITGDNGRYHVHIDWWGVTDKAGHKGVVGTTDRDITFVVPKKYYMPGADLGVTMECGPVVEKGTVGKTDSPLPYPDGFMLYSYISRKQSKESREPYTFTLQQAPVIDMNTLHSFNFSIFQSVLAGGVRHCLLTIQYVYEWVGPPPEYQQEEDDQAALAREKYDNIDVSAYEYNPFE